MKFVYFITLEFTEGRSINGENIFFCCFTLDEEYAKKQEIHYKALVEFSGDSDKRVMLNKFPLEGENV